MEIYQNQTQIARFPLEEDREFVYEHAGYRNVIRIREQSVFVEQADCPDQMCTRFLSIRNAGETIVCVPSGLRIVVTGGQGDGLDGVTG